MGNMDFYNKMKTPPKEAIKPIAGGKLKGFSDINPQWRYEILTEVFGVCGVGWKYNIVDTFTKDLADGQCMLFVKVELMVFVGDKWSEPITAIGGDFLIRKDKNGISGNDEAYKMATTDALGTCCKMLGVAGDVYRGVFETKNSSYTDTQADDKNPTKAKQGAVKPIADNQINAIKKISAAKNIIFNNLKLEVSQKYKKSIEELSSVEASSIIKALNDIKN